jgi:hypothetical protein
MRFLVDAMLGNLARWLRIFGYDTIFANDITKPGEPGATDPELAEYATENDRILITHDKEFARRFAGSIFVPGTDLLENLKTVQAALGIKLYFDQDQARCTDCNSELLRIGDKGEIQELVPPKTFARYDNFWICTNLACRKVYWQGSHFKDIHAVEEELLKNE